jgi:hypothetical protein
VAIFFFKTLKNEVFSALERVSIMAIVSTIADPDLLQGEIPFSDVETMHFAE